MNAASIDGPRLLAADESISLTCAGPLLVLVSLQPETDASMRLLEERIPAFANQAVSSIGLVFCALHPKPPPMDFVPRIAKTLVGLGPQLVRVGVAIERRGFVAAAQRSITTAVIAASSLSDAVRVVPTVRAAAEYVSAGLGDGGDGALVPIAESIVDSARKR